MQEIQPILPLPIIRENNPQPERIDIPAHVENWDDYWMCFAKVASIKSKDPKCPVGAAIVSEDNLVLSTGFNGLPRGAHDDEHVLEDADEKIRCICHAEDNAILNAARVGGRGLKGATIYVTKFPCLACCNAIVQAGIARICTHDDSFWNADPADPDHSRKKKLLREAHINVHAPFHPAFKPQEQFTVPKRKPPVRVTELPSAKEKIV